MGSESKIIVVTGGNRGIGQEICRQLAGMGHRVILCSRDLEKGKAAAAGMKGNVEVRVLDVGDEASIRQFAAELARDYERIDGLVNNAGVLPNSKGTMEVSMEEFRAVFEPNYFGPFLLSKLLVPLLRKSKGGRIVNLSSQMGGLDALSGGYAAYRLSKAAINALTLLMASELRSDGISVNAMCPGWVKTDMGGRGAPRSVEQGADTAVWLMTADQVPTGKFLSDRKVRAW